MFRALGDMSISRKGIVLVSVPMFAAIIFLVVLGIMLYISQEELRRETSIKDVVYAVESTAASINDGVMAMIMLSMRVDESWKKRLHKSMEQVQVKSEKFEKLIKNYPAVKEQNQHWYITVQRERMMASAVAESLDYGGMGILKNKGIPIQIQNLIVHEKATRYKLVQWLEEHQQQYQSNAANWYQYILVFLGSSFALNSAMSIALAVYYSRTINRRLGTLVDNSIRLAENRELNPVQKGQDEIGKLDRVFHKMALELQEAQEHEKAIVENARDVICSLDENCQFTAVNGAALKAWGYETAELVGKSFFDIMYADDVNTMRVAMHTISAGQRRGSLESRLIRADKTLIHVRWSVSWLSEDSTFYCVAHDITQRKLSEALLKESEQVKRLILDSMPVGLVIIDQERRVIESINNRTRQMFGLRVVSEVIGSPISILFPERSEELELSRFGGVEIESKKELLARKANGDTFPAELSISKYIINNAEKIVLVITDITARHEVEQLKRDFVAMVSHDLRTPLTTISMSIQMFREGMFGALNESGERNVGVVEQNLERLGRLVNTLLDIEKLESGQMNIQKASVDLKAILNQSIDTLSPLATEGGIKIDCSKIPACQIQGDSATLIQVMVNLLGNAIKFSPKESTITVSLEKNTDSVTVKVKDQGRGIPDDLKKDIFERFKQVMASDRTEKKGSGLGLAICKLIVEAHAGTIGVESKEGEGSTFWFQLPLE